MKESSKEPSERQKNRWRGEIKNSKSEIRNKFKMRNSKRGNPPWMTLKTPDFEFLILNLF